MKKRNVIGMFILMSMPACTESKADKQQRSTNKGTQMKRHKTIEGLEYETIIEGTGATPQAGKKVTVHYTGWLNNKGQPGKKFDSSVDRGTPFSFILGVGQVIRGWDAGVKSMKEGEKRRLFIPSSLGYGSQGAGGIIPPNADLIFDVELLKAD